MATVHLPAPANRLTNITAGWRYRSGALHAATDYGMPDRTPLYAVRDGVIADCQDGVVDYTPNRPGNKPGQPASGSPSNWVLLETYYQGRKATIYYQHLIDTKVVRGQKVKKGQLIGYSGQTGNATGPHLHIAGTWGGGYNRYTRYKYMQYSNGGYPYCIYAPSQVWKTYPAKVVPADFTYGKTNSSVKYVQRALIKEGWLAKGKDTGYYGPLTKAAYARAQLKWGSRALQALGDRNGYSIA